MIEGWNYEFEDNFFDLIDKYYNGFMLVVDYRRKLKLEKLNQLYESSL